MGTIYKIKNIINSKVYIGKTIIDINKRFKKHKNNATKKINRYLYDAMNFYGYENFIIEKIEDVDDNSKLNERERYWISIFKSNDSDFGYNMTIGGDGGKTRYYYGKSPYDWWVEKYGKEEADKIKNIVYKKISDKLKGKPGHIQTEETKNKIRQYNIENNIKPPIQYWKDKNHPFLGKNHSDISKNKISKARKDKKYEDIFDNDTSDRLKKMHKENWLNDKNPNFKNIDPHQILEYLENGKNNIEISKILNISVSTLISKFKNEFGVTPKYYKK